MLTIQQVEDTLNNSNELFLTFRKEMEEMSKKTKRLEKENLALTRKHDSTNRNILEMAEERTRDKDDLEKLRKQETHMRNIIKTMQEQGRGVGIVSNVPPELDLVDEEGTESEYDEEYEDEDEDEDEEGSFESEVVDGIVGELGKPPVFGPVPPPAMQEAKTNGTKAAAIVNGIKR
jgi:Myosin-like coiled-coil protein